MKSILFAIGVAIVMIVVAIAVGSVTWLFWDAWKATDLEAFRAILGAFSGAFFAYLFVRFGDALKKVYDRKETNHAALVKLQHYFNDCLSTTSDNIFIVDKGVDVFTDARLASEPVPIYMNNFHQYQINKGVVSQLTNIEFLNEVFSLNVTLRKMNDSLATIDTAYSQIRNSFLAKAIDVSTYIDHLIQYRNNSIKIKGFLLQLEDDLRRLLAVANILTQNPPFLVRVILALVRTKYPKKLDIQKEKERIVTEIEALDKADIQKIPEAQNRS